MFARIYQPAKTAMQSGKAKTHFWLLEFEREMAAKIEPLMGWTSYGDTQSSQVRIKFDSKEEAVAYAKKHHIPFEVNEPNINQPVLKSYADNFTTNRRKPWTH